MLSICCISKLQRVWNDVVLFSLLFCYVFAFYIGPMSISLIIALPLYSCVFLHKTYWRNFVTVISTPLIRKVSTVWFFIVFLSLLFPILYQTYDYTFFRGIAVQGIHLLAAFPVFTYLKTNGVTSNKVERFFVYIFVAQTIIQLIVVSNDTLGTVVLAFNHYEPDEVSGIGSNIRGKALSAATTYHLTLAYGIGFIVYLKSMLSVRVSLWHVLVGILIFTGIFFAGRSGFVGCLIGGIFFLFYRNDSIKRKVISLVYGLFLIVLCIVLLLYGLSQFAPEYYDLLETQVFPYAFEFFYSLEKSGEMETASTNQLVGMWNQDFDFIELILGCGKYSNLDGSYYMHVDPGILRHLLFMGVFGYIVLIVYQLCIIPFWKMKRIDKVYGMCIFLFILLMDFKGVTLGVNKFMFAIPLLLSFSCLYLHHKASA